MKKVYTIAVYSGRDVWFTCTGIDDYQRAKNVAAREQRVRGYQNGAVIYTNGLATAYRQSGSKGSFSTAKAGQPFPDYESLECVDTPAPSDEKGRAG